MPSSSVAETICAAPTVDPSLPAASGAAAASAGRYGALAATSTPPRATPSPKILRRIVEPDQPDHHGTVEPTRLAREHELAARDARHHRPDRTGRVDTLPLTFASVCDTGGFSPGNST